MGDPATTADGTADDVPSWREWARVATVGTVGVGLVVASIAASSTHRPGHWLTAVVVAAAVVLLSTQPLPLDSGGQPITVDAIGLAAMVGLVALRPVTFVVVALLGQMGGWVFLRARDGAAVRTALGWLKLSGSLTLHVLYAATAVAVFHGIEPSGPSEVVVAAVAAAAMAELATAVGLGFIIGARFRQWTIRQHMSRLVRVQLMGTMLVLGALVVALVWHSGHAAVWLAVSSVCLWWLARHQHRTHAELTRLRALARVAEDLALPKDRDEIAGFLVERARELTHASSATLSADPPRGTSIGVAVDDHGTWLTVHDRTGGAESFREPERTTLRELGAYATLALQAADLTEELRHASTHDQLTGVLSRRGLEDHWASAMRRASRHRVALGVVYIDLDRFKQVNDTKGHAAGDAVLRETARRLQAVSRGTDAVCRIGGDEFLVVVEDVTGGADVTVLAGRIREALATPTSPHGSIAASVGAAAQSGDGESLDDLIRVADAQMYEAKRRAAAATRRS